MIDALWKHLAEQKTDEDIVSKLEQFLEENEYDSDALKDDFEHHCCDHDSKHNQSNISKRLNNNAIFKSVQEWLYEQNRMFLLYLCMSAKLHNIIF